MKRLRAGSSPKSRQSHVQVPILLDSRYVRHPQPGRVGGRSRCHSNNGITQSSGGL
jgi:hypothetical protein